MNVYPIIMTSLLVATVATAGDVYLTGGSTSSSRASFGNYDNSTILELRAPSETTPAYFNGNGKTVNKIWVDSSSKISTDFVGGFVVDTNSITESDLELPAVAIDFAPSGQNNSFKLGGNYVYTIKSSAVGSSDSSFSINMLGDSTQPTSLVVDGGATLETIGNLTVLGRAQNVLEIGSTGKMTVSGAMTNWESKVSVSGKLEVATLNMGSDNLDYADTNASLIVNEGGTLVADNIVLNGDANDFSLNVDGTANVADTLSIRASNVSQINLSVGSKGILTAQTLDIAGKAESSGTLNLGRMLMSLENSQFTLNTGGVLNINANNEISEITKSTIKGTVNVKNGAIVYISAENGFTLKGGTLNVENGCLMQTKDATGSGNPYMFVSNGANSAINVRGSGKVNLTATSRNDDLKISAGSLSVSSDNEGAILARKITFYSAKLVLNSRKTFASADGVYGSVINIAANCTADVFVNDVVQFGSVWYAASGSSTTLKLTFDNDGVFVLDTFKQLGSVGGNLVFSNFNTEKIFLLDSSMSVLPSWLDIKGKAWNGRTLVKADFSLEAGTFEGAGGWWLYAANVPEPATFASILGALAIAFAVVRRRISK